MNTTTLKIVFTSAGALVFNLVFWNEKLALNGLLFDGFILAALFTLYPGAIHKPAVRWILAAHLVAIATLVYHNTVLSKITFSTTLLLLVVFVQFAHRSLWYAGGSAFMNFVLMVPSFWNSLKSVRVNGKQNRGFKKRLRFLVIPVILLLIFGLLYSSANSVFNQLTNDIAQAISHFFSNLFDFVTPDRFLFLLFGLFVSGGLLIKSKIDHFSVVDLQQPDELFRKKNNPLERRKSYGYELVTLLMGRFADGMMALRNEHSTGIISLLLLNVLLLLINSIDVIYIWLGAAYTGTINHSAAVHEGAGLLIFSIALAMVLLLFFFRGNLNFYTKNKWLKRGAYLWILQNLILVVSVFIRDYYYIQHNGLAYKRIGVLFFLLLVIAGLLTVFIKIYFKKTNYYLLKVNAWFAMAVLVVAACIHWDETIASYNLARKNTLPLDVKFLLTLSDKTLPLLEMNKDIFDNRQLYTVDSEADLVYSRQMDFKTVFENRKQQFANEQLQYSWLSWNGSDAWVKQQLSKDNATSSLLR